jgi:uncharacterized membrane protein YidH (DUF202 family)
VAEPELLESSTRRCGGAVVWARRVQHAIERGLRSTSTFSPLFFFSLSYLIFGLNMFLLIYFAKMVKKIS